MNYATFFNNQVLNSIITGYFLLLKGIIVREVLFCYFLIIVKGKNYLKILYLVFKTLKV